MNTIDITQPVRRPGGAIASRPLEFLWLCDTSGSMSGVKIERLNFAIADALGPMRDAARENPQAQIFVRVMQFDDDARWVTGKRTPIDEFSWSPLRVQHGMTAMGAALSLAAAELESPPLPNLYWPPVVVLVTDGFPTNSIAGQPTFGNGLVRFMASAAGRSAIRLGIAIGDEADLSTLERFIGDPAIPPLQARTAGELFAYIRWTSTASIRRSTAPAAKADGSRIPFAPGAAEPPADGDLAWSESLD